MLAPDKYKGSLTAVQAARAMAEGVKAALPEAEVTLCPMADGGDGTVDAVAGATGAELRESVVRGPLPGQSVKATWAYLPAGRADLLHGSRAIPSGGPARDRTLAVLEMAQASGLDLIPVSDRDPLLATTYGTGQLIREALEADCGTVVVGLGGSATVDGGTGMARALGFRLLDSKGEELEGCGGSLVDIAAIDPSGRYRGLDDAVFIAAGDVDNPLTGEDGAAKVYGPQKGAGPKTVEFLERGMENLAEIMRRDLGADPTRLPGAGAAGGLGAGLMVFCGASMARGVDIVADIMGLREAVRGSDLVLTGEGYYDGQTARGKTPAGVAAVAAEEGVPVIVVAGQVEWKTHAGEGTPPAYCILPAPMSLEQAMREAETILATGTERLLRALLEVRRTEE